MRQSRLKSLSSIICTLFILSLALTIQPQKTLAQTGDAVSVTYQAHVQNTGWQSNWVSDGQEAGTEAQSLSLEALKIKLVNAPANASIKYEAHVRNIGWQNWVSDGQEAGTDGKSLRVEALKITLENMPGYSIEYQAYVQNIGWQSWVSDGQEAGTDGKSLRVEAIRIRIVKISDNSTIGVQYQSHVKNIGWQESVSNGQISGTEGLSLRVEALKINLLNAPAGAGITYDAHVANIGWQKIWVSDGQEAGTHGQSLQMEAIKISLVNMPGYSVQYRVHVAYKGWQDWVSDGQLAGTVGQALRIEAIEIRIVLNIVHPTAVSLDKTIDSLMVGDTDTLVATVAPTDATNKAVTWGSSDSTIATVDNAGKVTAVHAGTATITATSVDGSKTAICAVTVALNDGGGGSQPVITNVSMVSSNANNTKAMNGDTITLTFTSDEPVTKLGNFKINGSNPNTFTNVGNVYTATHLVDAGDAVTGVPATFQINVKNAAGIFSVTVEGTTDGSFVTIVDEKSAPVNLGTAGDYVILAKTGISTDPASNITGNIGVGPIAATGITGFGLVLPAGGAWSMSSQVTGKVYAPGYANPTPANLTTAVDDMEKAYTDAAGKAVNYVNLYAGDISGKTLTAGVYKYSTGVSINTDVTLNGGADDVWIFQIAGKITQASATKIILTGGAQAKNIFWQAADTVSIGTTAHFEGIVLAMTNIELKTGATVYGRLLAQTAVTLQANTVVDPSVELGAAVTGLDVPANVLQLGRTITTATAATIEASGGTWTSSDPAVATVDGSTGVVTALAAGTTTIAYTASTSGKLNSKLITVYAAAIDEAPTIGVVQVGAGDVTPTGFTAAGDGQTIAWVSSDAAKATVIAATGVIHAVAAGEPTISYAVTETATGRVVVHGSMLIYVVPHYL